MVRAGVEPNRRSMSDKGIYLDFKERNGKVSGAWCSVKKKIGSEMVQFFLFYQMLK